MDKKNHNIILTPIGLRNICHVAEGRFTDRRLPDQSSPDVAILSLAWSLTYCLEIIPICRQSSIHNLHSGFLSPRHHRGRFLCV
jgi:hypothetical protein